MTKCGSLSEERGTELLEGAAPDKELDACAVCAACEARIAALLTERGMLYEFAATAAGQVYRAWIEPMPIAALKMSRESEHLKGEVREQARCIAEWASAGQQVVDLFDPLKPSASPDMLIMAAKAVKEANAEIRARLVQGGAALNERLVQVSELEERNEISQRYIDELTFELKLAREVIAAEQKANAEIVERGKRLECERVAIENLIDSAESLELQSNTGRKYTQKMVAASALQEVLAGRLR